MRPPDFTASGPEAATNFCLAPPGPAPLARPKALLVVHAGGTVELYGPDTLDVAVVLAPAGVSGPLAERMIEEFVELTAPAWSREVYWPASLRAVAHSSDCPTPSEMLQRTAELRILRILDRFASPEERIEC